MKLTHEKKLTLRPTAPFHFDATFHKPDHFTTGDNYWSAGTRWQTLRWQGRAVGLRFQDQGSSEKPTIELTIYSHEKLDESFYSSLSAEVSYRYNLALDLAPFYTAAADDPILAPIVAKWRGMRPGHPSSLYEYLVIGVVLQNATVRRSIQMFSALLENFGTLLEYDGQKLWCFWDPGSLTTVFEEDLRALKLGYRAKTIKRLDDRYTTDPLDEIALREKDCTTQRDILLSLYGVGPATVWYLLFDVFHHWDFFDHVSPWEQKIYSKLFFNVDPEAPVPVADILAYFARFGAFRQLAVHYVWEDLWWRRKNESLPWLDKLIRV